MDSQANNTTLTFMLIVAGMFDLTQFLLMLAFGVGLILNSIVTIFAITIFFIWLSMNGMMDMKTGMRLVGFGAGETFPFINALPLWLAFVASIIIIQKKAALGPLGAAIPTGGVSPKK